jgi:TRAP-type C4-dicarboxylate transport system permease small subunit
VDEEKQMKNEDMPPRQSPFQRLERVIKKGVEFFVILLAVLLVLDVVAGVFTRYVLNAALPWTDELGGYLLGWLSFLGAALLFNEDGHISFELLVNSLPKCWRRSIILCGYLISIAFFLIVAYEAIFLIKDLSGSLGISVPVSKPVVYSVILVSSAAAICFLAFRAVAVWIKRD